jgi:hypothetical protein
MKTKLFFTALAILAASMVINAQAPGNKGGKGLCNGTFKSQAYVDNNKNGICDNYENRNSGTPAQKGKGIGKCNGTGQGTGQGKCQGKGNGQGKGINFVDENNNGICDKFEARTKK